eukprot:TRINITY_DN3837_c0_g1_i1.p2 TRINITY_DN3837_c0_g1~~TRINITY_DN3837_c0_g1_i1.p2  ORF type:complete len:336 (-),score=114.08 TRINITY_DN3837_c0_g1_i1:114-1121(-)
MTTRTDERVAVFRAAVSSESIDFRQIRDLAFQGIPDAPALRSVYWKLLLSYLPNDRAQWPALLDKSRAAYRAFVSELVIDPHRADHADQPAEPDHPLSTSASSTWNAFFKDGEIIEEIDKDVRRTLPHMQFFAMAQHSTALRQILFIYAKLNPGIRYVQGMNEVLAPLYYVFCRDAEPPQAAGQDDSEADAFFVFSALMGEIRDGFCKSLDKSETGVHGLLERFSQRLLAVDAELWHDFAAKKLDPQFYSFRWLTLLLSQEFELPDVLRVWDALFADARRFDFLYDVCCAMLSLLRESLLDGSFADNLKLLQNYPIQDVEAILARAVQLVREPAA